MLNLGRTHEVEVDAISAGTGIGGTSYQLVAKGPGVARGTTQHDRALACVQAALESKGMFEAPPKAPPDVLISVDYGIGNSIPKLNGPPALEKYLQLSARKNPGSAATLAKSEEVWNVRVTITEPRSSIEGCLPFLAAVAADYAGLDTQSETVITVAENSPTVARIRSVLSGGAGKP